MHEGGTGARNRARRGGARALRLHDYAGAAGFIGGGASRATRAGGGKRARVRSRVGTRGGLALRSEVAGRRLAGGRFEIWCGGGGGGGRSGTLRLAQRDGGFAEGQSHTRVVTDADEGAAHADARAYGFLYDAGRGALDRERTRGGQSGGVGRRENGLGGRRAEWHRVRGTQRGAAEGGRSGAVGILGRSRSAGGVGDRCAKPLDEAAAGGAGAGGWRRLSALRCVRHGGPSLAERSVENESRGAGCSDRSATQSWWWDDFAGYHHRRIF